MGSFFFSNYVFIYFFEQLKKENRSVIIENRISCAAVYYAVHTAR